MSCTHSGSRNRIVALTVLTALLLSPLARGGPFRALKVENGGRYIQLAVHLLAPGDGLVHPMALPGVFWATPYTAAGAPAAAVAGTSQHLIAPHPGPPWNEPAPGPLHGYALAVGPAIPPPRALAFARLLHGTLHPDVFVEVLAATPAVAVFADIGVHDPPPAQCVGLQAAPTGEEAVPPTPSDAVAATALYLYAPDSTLSLGIVVSGIDQGQLIASAIHLGLEGTPGSPIFDLGNGAAWENLDGFAIGRLIEDAPFPPEHVEALLNGETYVNLCTIAHPDGELRGQIRVLPWEENFERYATNSSMHGQGGWKGWDNDPVGTAYVTDTPSLSPPHSVDIAGNSDLVHEFSGCDSGKWAFTAWSYVPGDFVSGGSDPFLGSFFIMLNTYADGGLHENSDWSVQMNFDSNDGMLKVYHGNGLNTVDVPYIPDEWVELQVVIDLDDDLTRICYNDECVAEYSWIGGVLGDGGGALNIAAVDLFANQSTSVFWDDLSLVPYTRCTGDLDGDGDVNLTDLAILLSNYGMTGGAEYEDGDLDEDGDVDLTDLAGLLAVYGTVCG